MRKHTKSQIFDDFWENPFSIKEVSVIVNYKTWKSHCTDFKLHSSSKVVECFFSHFDKTCISSTSVSQRFYDDDILHSSSNVFPVLHNMSRKFSNLMHSWLFPHESLNAYAIFPTFHKQKCVSKLTDCITSTYS